MTDTRTGASIDRLPTLVRTRNGYRVHDPALLAGTSYVIDDAGDLVWTRVPAGAMTAGAVITSLVVAVTTGDNSWTWSVLTFLVALPVSFAAAIAVLSVVHAVTDPVRAYRARFGHARFAVDVTDRASTEWQLCSRAERLAASRSWQAGRIDPTRTLGGLLWTAVGSGEAWAGQALHSLAEPATGPDLTAV